MPIRMRYNRRPFQPPDRGTLPVPDELTLLREADTRIRAALAARDTAISEAQAQLRADSGLTAQGVTERLNQAREQADATLARTIAGLRTRVEAARETLAQLATAAVLRNGPATGVEALMQRQIHWGRVRQMVEAGVDLGEIIATATDPEQLHAIADELPTFARVAGLDPQTRDAALADVAGRLAVLAGDTAAVRHGDHLEAEGLHAETLPKLDRAAAIAAGQRVGDGLGAALNARMRGAEARARLGLAQPPRR